MAFPIIATGIILFITYIWYFYSNVKKYPKGPTPLPIVGNLLNFDFPNAPQNLEELSKTYGNIFTIWLPKPTVCIMNHEAIKEAFQKEEFSGRGETFPDTMFEYVKNGGIIFSQGEIWKEQRRTSLHILRDFGMGKGQMETQVRESMQDCISHVYDICKSNQSVNFRWPLQLFVGNVISNTLFGTQYKYDDCERLKAYCNMTTEDFSELRESNLIFLPQIIPGIEKVPFIRNLVKGNRNMPKFFKLLEEDMAKCLKGYDPNIEPANFCQAYYQKMTRNGNYEEGQLINICSDFFIAGLETTSTTLRWAVLYMVVYQDVQDKMRKEIEETIGLNAFPSMADKQKLPYCNAVVNEIQRCANIVSMNVVHRTTSDTSVSGYSIPADTKVYGQIYSVHRNNEVYNEFEKFRPERFLEADGKTPNKRAVENLSPFSIGKRQCAGESMARLELFLGLVSLVQNFKLEEDPNHTVSLTPALTVVITPEDKPLRITPING